MSLYDGKTQDEKNMIGIGIVMMVFAIINIGDVIFGFIDSSDVTTAIGTTAASSGVSASTVFTVAIVIMVIAIICDLVQLYFGWIAIKLRPTKVAAILSLIICILFVLTFLGNIVDGFAWSDLGNLVNALVGFLYWFYYRKLPLSEKK